MKAATPADKNTQQAEDKKKKKRRQAEASQLPMRHAEIANAQTQKPDAPTKGNAEGPSRQDTVPHNGVPAVHGAESAYSQGAERMYQQLQESLQLTGDLNHPDTQKKEMNYKMTLGIDELREYHNSKPDAAKPAAAPQPAETQVVPETTPKPAEVQAKPADKPAVITPVTAKPESAPPAAEKETAAEKPADIKAPIADKGADAGTAAPDAIIASPAAPKAPAPAAVADTQVKPADNTDAAPAEQEAPLEAAAAPQSAAENPAFVNLQGQIGTTAKAQKQHEPATKSAQDAQAAAPSPSNERESKAQAGQVEEMDAQKPGEFDADSFKAELMQKIEKMELPKDEEHAAEFDKNNNIKQVNDSAMVSVKAEKNEAAGNIAKATSKKPDTSKQPVRQVAKMPTAPHGKAPSALDATKAMPVKRNEAAVEQPVKEQTAHLDDQMKENGITDNMLANSNEPSFTKALDDKNKAKAQTQASAVQFRQDENGELVQTRNQAQQQVTSQVSGMHTGRKSGLDKAHANQAETAGKDTAKRKEIADRVNSIYKASKSEVDGILKNLDAVVAYKFAAGARAAKYAFEKHVAEKMQAYKKERYGEWYSWKNIKRVKDAFGLPKEVNRYFVTGRAAYIKTLNDYITDIAHYVAAQLKAAKARIAAGRKGVADYVASLSPALKKLGKEAITAIQGKFSALEKTVNDKKDALIEVLAKKYTENVKALDKRIDLMKKANAGIIGLVSDAIMSVVGVIIDMKNKLMSLLAKIGEVVMSIIMDPIGFFKNLIAGVGQGVSNFAANIWTHLKTGFFSWLTGAMQGVSFTMPEDAFSLKGIFSIAMQVLGIGWDGIRAIGSAVVGEPVMKALETGEEIVQAVRKDGIAGLWDYLKDQFQDLKATIMDSIMDIIQNQVIQAGIKWILGLLSPVGAFVKAIMAIIDVVKFFVQRAAQIAELISAFMESVSAIASGKVGAVAKSIENALGKAIPVLIGLLASILGISGLADKVLGVIRKIRERITKGITKFWNFVKEKGKALLGKVGIGKKDKKVDDKHVNAMDSEIAPEPFTMNGKSHTLTFEKGEIYMASDKGLLNSKINSAITYIQNTPNGPEINGKGSIIINNLQGLQKDYIKTKKQLGDANKIPDTDVKKADKIKNAQKALDTLASEISQIGNQYKLIDLTIDSEHGDQGLKVGIHPIDKNGLLRESHHVPENKFMDRMQEFYGETGKTLNTTGFNDLGAKLLQRQQHIQSTFSGGNKLSAILLHQNTHTRSGKGVHGKDLQVDLTPVLKKNAQQNKELIFISVGKTEIKRAKMSEEHWDNLIKDVFILLVKNNLDRNAVVKDNKDRFLVNSKGNKKGTLEEISVNINEQIKALFDKFANINQAVPSVELTKQKNAILEQINETAGEVFTSVLTAGLATVAGALNESNNDGDKSEHPKALRALEALANEIWRTHIIKPIKL